MRFSILCSLLVLVNCSEKRSDKEDGITQKSDSLEFPLRNPSIITDQLDSVAVLELDSLLRIKWTDKIMPAGLVASRLYSARFLAKYNSVGKFDVVAVNTRADDWGKSFLITTDNEMNFIDYFMITDGWSDAIQNEKGEEIVTERNARTKRVNDSSFIRTTIQEEIRFYGEGNQQTKKDSITDLLRINSHGKFLIERIDSTRSMKGS